MAAVCHPDAASPLNTVFPAAASSKMKRLRIELRRKPLYILRGDRNLSRFEAHPQRQIIEPLDHLPSLQPCGFLAAQRSGSRNPLLPGG